MEKKTKIRESIINVINSRAKRFRDLSAALQNVVDFGIDGGRYNLHQGAKIAEKTIEGYMATIHVEELSKLIEQLEKELGLEEAK